MTYRINWSVLLFALGASLLTGVIFGLGSRFACRQDDLTDVLKQEGRGSTGSGEAGTHAAPARDSRVRAFFSTNDCREPSAAQFLGFAECAAGIQSTERDDGPDEVA